MKQGINCLALAAIILLIAGCAKEDIIIEEPLSEDAEEESPAEENKLPTCAEAGGECLDPFFDRCSGIKFESDKEVSDCPGRCCVCCKQIIQECVPDSCCHARGCMLVQSAPDCSGTVCSMECREGTMDCGQGACYFNMETLDCDVNWQTEMPA